MSALKNMNAFLGGVDLPKYREKYARIKLVELDMPRHIQPIRHLYREYWERRARFPSYENFYGMYSGELAKELETFRKEAMFSKETFYRGLPARIYRTWASLLTQIQGGYAAEIIYGKGSVSMRAELDYAGIDMQIADGAGTVNIQVKKESMSREIRAPWQFTRKQTKIVVVTYEVPGKGPLTKTGKPCKPFNDWREKWRGKLERLDNGFIIFLPDMFSPDNIKTP